MSGVFALMTQPKEHIAKARKLRKSMSEAERLLWSRLKIRMGDDLTFKRSVGIKPYVLDFFCHEAQLAIEVDGAHHGLGDRPNRDERRDLFFERLGIFTYRIPAADVYRNADAVADGIRLLALERCQEPHHHAARASRSPSPTSGEEQE